MKNHKRDTSNENHIQNEQYICEQRFSLLRQTHVIHIGENGHQPVAFA